MVEEEGHHSLALSLGWHVAFPSCGSRMFTRGKPARITMSLFSPITCTLNNIMPLRYQGHFASRKPHNG